MIEMILFIIDYAANPCPLRYMRIAAVLAGAYTVPVKYDPVTLARAGEINTDLRTAFRFPLIVKHLHDQQLFAIEGLVLYRRNDTAKYDCVSHDRSLQRLLRTSDKVRDQFAVNRGDHNRRDQNTAVGHSLKSRIDGGLHILHGPRNYHI